MKKIPRHTVLTIIASIEIMNLSEEEIEDYLYAEYRDDEGENISYETVYDKSVQDFLIDFKVEYECKGYSNEYLVSIVKQFLEIELQIIGEPDKLEKCPCCSFLTLEERGEYHICPVCSWEDAGFAEENPNQMNSVNRSTLTDARKKFGDNINNVEFKFVKG